MRVSAEKISSTLVFVSFCGLALFVPFSISGDNISLMLGFVGILIGIAAVPSTRARVGGAKRDPMLYACLLLVVSALPSVAMSENIQRAVKDWKSYWLLIIYFFVAYGLGSWRLRRAVYWILFVSTGLSCLVAVAQYVGGIDFLFVHIHGKPRPSSTLYIMTFAGIICQLITVNFAVLFHRGRFSRLEWLITGGLAVQVFGLFLSLTRGAWVALAAGLGAATVFMRRRASFVFAGALVALVVVVAALDPDIRLKLGTIPRALKGPTDVNVGTRYVLWDVSKELIGRHPFFGVGMGDFETEAQKLIGERHVMTATDSHNVYLQVLVTRGIVGFVPFLCFIATLFASLWRARRELSPRGGFGLYFVNGVTAAAVAVFVGALTENNIDDSEVFIAFMLLTGMAKSFVVSPDPEDAGRKRMDTEASGSKDKEHSGAS